MHEVFLRVSIRRGGSFLPHGAIYKLSRDIMKVGDVWRYDASPLELQNAETKRIASASASARLTFGAAGEARKPLRGDKQGPANLVKTKAYSTTMALSTLRNLLSKQYLRRGDGIISIPDSRRRERLFGDLGRSKLRSAGIKHEIRLADPEYRPRDDTCLRAFVRLLAAKASSEHSPDPP